MAHGKPRVYSLEDISRLEQISWFEIIAEFIIIFMRLSKLNKL